MNKIMLFLFLFYYSTSVLFSQTNLINWTDSNSTTYVKSANTNVSFVVIANVLQISLKEKGRYFLSLSIPDNNRDISKNTSISFQVANAGKAKCQVIARINDEKWAGGSVALNPGESDKLEIVFLHNPDKTLPFINMDGVPGRGLFIWDPIDANNLNSIQIEILTNASATVSLDNIIATGNYMTEKEVASKEDFFPFIDKYGQYKHNEWPGKTHSDQDMARNLENEMKELNILKGPATFNKYGGWENGPKLKATGNFYVEKVYGNWWLVDPEGNLFWSHGVNCAGFGSGNTQITGREKYFPVLENSEPNYNFYQANLTRKFGNDWREKASLHIHNRLRSWGMNTIANWSDASVYLSNVKRTPYTATIGYRSPSLDGSEYKFPDVFDSKFKESVEEGIKRSIERTINDPWCIGYFLDNELYLSEYNKLSNVVMKQKPGGAAKTALIEYMKDQYKSVRELNKKYNTKYPSWNRLLNETSLPDRIVTDLQGFHQIIIDKYFSICSKAMKEIVPEKLYLGNRFNLYRIYYPDETLINYAIKKAAEYCDVVSINYYRFNCEELVLPEGIDRPIIIGEFHFGALDRGLPHTGLRNVANQKQRADFYEHYVGQALNNPQIVGTHWFQYGDQPYTARGDGENYQIGFVDICDSPYPETINAIRNIGYNMYSIRSNNGSKE